jgi:hypothetical protein
MNRSQTSQEVQKWKGRLKMQSNAITSYIIRRLRLQLRCPPTVSSRSNLQAPLQLPFHPCLQLQLKMKGFSTEKTIASCPDHTRKAMSHLLWWLLKEDWVILNLFLKIMTYTDALLLLAISQQMWHKFCCDLSHAWSAKSWMVSHQFWWINSSNILSLSLHFCC